MRRSCRFKPATAGFGLAVAGALALAAALCAPAADVEADPEAVLARVKAELRSHARPPYVRYTLVRRESLDGLPDLENSYTLEIWCRTSDGAALSRRAFNGRARGAAEFIVPAFDRPLDPGPPTADLLDVIRQSQAAATPEPPPGEVAGRLPVIGSVAVAIETHYRLAFAGSDRADYHLRLEARREPDRNRLTDLYVDRVTYAVHRAVAHDHLYIGLRAVPERFEIDFGGRDGVPVITAIHGQTEYRALSASDANEPLHEVDYRFEDVAFPADLPAWYFDPAQYGAHRADYPA